jgi:glycosyltransferase involved in cell wall biosynthesis
MSPAGYQLALLYDDDGYVEVPGQPPRGPAGNRTGLMGRQVAGKEFLDALFRHGSWTALHALVRNQASARSFLRYCQAHLDGPARRRTARVVDERRFHQLFFPTPPAPLLYYPCPPDQRYAWARQHGGPGSYALCGVTHTLCSQRALEWLCGLVTAPFEPYDALICTSRAVLNMVRAVTATYADYLRDRHGGTPQARIRLETIPLGVDTERFRPPTPEERAARRQAFGVADDEVAVLFVGRLAHHAKAHPFPMFVGLNQAARATGRKVHLILSGWAPNAAVLGAFQDGVRDFAPDVRVTWVDGTDPRHRFSVWHAADVFTSMSDNIQETFGLVVVEAMASGLPVVATDWDGYRDLVAADETGFLVPTAMVRGATVDTTSRLVMEEANYDHFLAECSQAVAVDSARAAEAFTRLIGDAALRQQTGAAGRRRAVERFDWGRVIAAYEELWRSQEVERQAAVGGRSVTASARGPAGYPAPEVVFAGYPTAWLDDGDRLQALPGAEIRLARVLVMPLTNHVPNTRTTDLATLRRVLSAAATPRPLAELDDVLRRAGVGPVAARATLAWMLKYDLLRRVPSAASP